MQEITEKIRNNAIITYLFILVNITFLFSKKSDLNNDFVKNHTKTAIFIHLAFLINTIIFAYIGLGINFQILNYNISDIIAIIIYLILTVLLILGIYKAHKNETFSILENLNYKNNKKIFDINNDGNFSEKDKLTIILSKIPFIGFLIYPKFKNNKIISSNTKLNMIITFVIIFLYVFGNYNLANLLFLLYIIFIIFSSINLLVQNKIIHINMENIPDLKKILKYLKTFKIYLGNYFGNKKEFESFSSIYKKITSEEKTKNINIEKNLNLKNDFKLNKYIIYIPILNLISLFNTNVKQQKHIINGILITIITLIILALNYYFGNYNLYLLFLLFPIFFGIAHLYANKNDYEIPFLFSIYNFFVGIKNKIKSLFSKAKVLKNTEKNLNLKVGENKKSV